jgi:hypothetical protein
VFDVPNQGDAAFADQARLFSQDLDILAAALAGTGVVSGCSVTAQATPDMTVAVAAGTVRVAGVAASVAAGNVAIGAAHATNARIDLVVVDNTGAKSVTAGTAAASATPPAIPASSVVLAFVYVPAADTAINTDQITDKRATAATTAGRLLTDAESTSGSYSPTASYASTGGVVPALSFIAPPSGAVIVEWSAGFTCGDTGAVDAKIHDGTAYIAGTIKRLFQCQSATMQGQFRYRVKITGLTPGTACTFTLHVKSSGGGSPSIESSTDSTIWGQAVGTVVEAP